MTPGRPVTIDEYYADIFDHAVPGLPEAATVREIPLEVPLRVYSRDGRLIQEIGMARARRYVMLSERIDGVIAAEWGLAHESVPDDQLDEALDPWRMTRPG